MSEGLQINEIQKFIVGIHPLNEEEFEVFFGIFQFATLKKGEYFLVKGKREYRMGLLFEGVIRSYIHGSNGKEINKHLFTRYESVGGYSSLITKEPSQFYYQALTDCKLLVANYEDMLGLFDNYPNIERLNRKWLEMLFVAKEEREVELLSMDATKRYLNLRNKKPNLEQEISLHHIASYLGITATQLSRIRKSILFY